MKIKCNQNQVAIRPLDGPSHHFYIDDLIDEMRHVSVRGRVEAIPGKLLSGSELEFGENLDLAPEYLIDEMRLDHEFSLERPTQLQVSVGDEVMFSYTVHMNYMRDNSYLIYGNNLTFIVKYDMLYFNFTTNQPLNEFVFVEPIGIGRDDLVWNGLHLAYPGDSIPGVGRIVYGPGKGTMVRFPSVQVAPEYKYHQTMNPDGLPLLRVPFNETFAYSEKE